MKIILREDIAGLGRSGEMVTVRDGFGRNFLLPRNMATLASEKNLRQLEHDKRVIAARQSKLRAAAGDVAAALGRTDVQIARKVGEQDKLYGSVTTLDIAEALASRGVKIDRRHIVLHDPIKTLGVHEVEIRLHSDVVGKVKVTVVAEG